MFNLHECLYLMLGSLLGYNLIVFVPLIVLSRLAVFQQIRTVVISSALMSWSSLSLLLLTSWNLIKINRPLLLLQLGQSSLTNYVKLRWALKTPVFVNEILVIHEILIKQTRDYILQLTNDTLSAQFFSLSNSSTTPSFIPCACQSVIVLIELFHLCSLTLPYTVFFSSLLKLKLVKKHWTFI